MPESNQYTSLIAHSVGGQGSDQIPRAKGETLKDGFVVIRELGFLFRFFVFESCSDEAGWLCEVLGRMVRRIL